MFIIIFQRKRELTEQGVKPFCLTKSNGSSEKNAGTTQNWELNGNVQNGEAKNGKTKSESALPSHLPKRTVNQQTSPTKPYCPPTSAPNGNGKDDNPFSSYPSKIRPYKAPEPNYSNFHLTAKNGDHIELLERRKSMTKISEEGDNDPVVNGQQTDEKTSDDPTLKFQNLVDSVRIAEDRISLAQKGVRSLKSLKYIFPTSYIGNSTTSQETVNLSNATNSICKMPKKPECNIGKSVSYPVSYSGIPIPTNGTNGKHSGFLSTILSAKKFIKDSKSPETKKPNPEDVPVTIITDAPENEEKVEESSDVIEETAIESIILKSASMTASLYVAAEEEEQEPPKTEETRSSSSSASVITSPSEGEGPAAEVKKEGQTFK